MAQFDKIKFSLTPKTAVPTALSKKNPLIDNVKQQSILPARRHFPSSHHECTRTLASGGAERHYTRDGNRGRSRSPDRFEDDKFDGSYRDQAESQDQGHEDPDMTRYRYSSDPESDCYCKHEERTTKRKKTNDGLQKQQTTSCSRYGNSDHITRDCHLDTDDEIGGTRAEMVPERNSSPADDGTVPTPPTAYDFCAYSQRIFSEYLNRSTSERFIHGYNGKVLPSNYGSDIRHDLGLCYATFLTSSSCEMGVNCPWRHHPLTKAERDWIDNWESDRGKAFLEEVDKFWAFPDVPVPGHNMQNVGSS